MEPIKKKTPSDTTEFDREQLRFFLASDDVAVTLAELNPSLAWLPELAKMKVIQRPGQLTMWIERNFADIEAVREVAANLEYFDEASADLLEGRLNRQHANLPPLLAKSWRLIIRHIRNERRGVLRGEWFELQPRLKLRDFSPELLAAVAEVLRPKPKIGPLISWREKDNPDATPQKPSDLMSIEYEVESGLTETEILAAWPQNLPADLDFKFLALLSDTLNAATEDAIDVQVETNRGYGISDIDIPSVAAHSQNQYHGGFLPIVRTIADVWSRLVQKNAALGLPFVQRWSSSELKLNQRLALFAAGDEAVPVDNAAEVLLALPQHLLFHTNTTVEVFRLIRRRWAEISVEKRRMIENRIAAGPPRNSYRDDIDTASVENMVDRARYDLLGEMHRSQLALNDASERLLADIRSKYPEWELRPSEQAGFHIWHGGSFQIRGDSKKLRDLPDEQLVDEAQKAADSAGFMSGDDWEAFCGSYPERALRGLEAKAERGEWPDWAWKPFLWSAQKLENPKIINLAADLLLKFPQEDFRKIADTASWWLDQKAKALDDNRLWPLWDKIELGTAAEGLEDA
jgi:hypothetical protein